MQNRRSVLAAIFGFFVLAAATSRADDWPQWRGPNRDGVWNESGALKPLPAGGVAIRWRFPVHRGFSSPIMAQGRVYVTDAELVQPKILEHVYCLDAETGTLIWKYSADVRYPDWIFMAGQERGPGPTPILRDGRLYVLGGFAHVVCLDATLGSVHWSRNLLESYQFEQFPTDASPLIDGERLILLVGGKPRACVLALDAKSGTDVWRALDERSTHSSPIIVQAGGVRQLIVWTQQSVSSLNPEDGQVYWREALLTSADYAVATPVAWKDKLLVGGMMFRLAPERPAATVLWSQSRAVSRRVLSNTSSALFHGEQVFSAKMTGELVCLDAESGAQLWEADTVTDLRTGASIHLIDHGDVAFLFTDRGELIQAKLNAAGYSQVGRVALLEPTWPFMGRNVAWATPAFANGRVYARNDRELICASLAAEP